MDKQKQLILKIMKKALTLPKSYSLKRAKTKDVDIIWKIKNDCSYERDLERREKGERSRGFILGCSKEKYIHYIENAYCHIMYKDETPIGYSVILPRNISVEGSTMTESNIKWKDQDAVNATLSKYIYYDQYCIHPDYANRSLAFNMIVSLCYDLWKRGIRHVFGSVISEPTSNENSHRVLRSVGMREAAEVREYYNGIGEILTTLYYTNSDDWFKDI